MVMQGSKADLLQHCIAVASSRVQALDDELAYLRDAAGAEGRSTAGDKHETGRAMVHLEQEKLTRQRAEAKALLAELERTVAIGTARIGIGSLVVTQCGTFLIAAGLGKVEWSGGEVFVLSPKAPVAAALMGHAVGETVSANGTVFRVEEVT